MYRYLIVASVLLSSCGSSSGGNDAIDAPQVGPPLIQLPQSVEVTTLGSEGPATNSWYDIMEFEPNGDTLSIAGTRLVDGVPTEDARTYHVCEIDAMVILPTYLVPTLLECGEEYLAATNEI